MFLKVTLCMICPFLGKEIVPLLYMYIYIIFIYVSSCYVSLQYRTVAYGDGFVFLLTRALKYSVAEV